MNMKIVKRGIFLTKKYGLFICIPIFLLIAYSFVSSSATQYRATAKIALKNISAGSAANDIQSKYFIQKVLDRLHFQVSYYDSLQPDKEIYGDTLPIRLVFNPADKIRVETTVSIRVTDANTFDLSHVDTVISLKFNEPLDEYYGRFSVVHSAGESYKHVAYILRLHEPGELIARYSNALHLETNDDKTLTLRVSSGNPEKSIDFLDELIRLFKATDIKQNKETGKATAQAKEKQLQELSKEATALKSRIKQLSATNTAKKTGIRTRPTDDRQFRIYQVIKPYVEAPVRQFVQVPYTDEVGDIRLRNLLDRYNKLQLKKQHILVDKRNGSAVILQADNDLINGRNAIIAAIYPDKQNQSAEVSPQKIADSLNSLRSSLTQVGNDIQALENPSAAGIGVTSPENAGLVVLESPKDNIETLVVNPFWAYALAMIAGLLVPVVWWVIREPRGNILPSNLLNPQKLIERINDLFAVKQID